MLAVTANPFFCGTPGSRTPMSGISHRCIKSTSAKVHFGWPGGIRTHNPPVKSRIHCQLCHEPILWLTPGIEPCSPLAQSGTLPDMLTSTYIRYRERIRTFESCSKNRRVTTIPPDTPIYIYPIRFPSGVYARVPRSIRAQKKPAVL